MSKSIAYIDETSFLYNNINQVVFLANWFISGTLEGVMRSEEQLESMMRFFKRLMIAIGLVLLPLLFLATSKPDSSAKHNLVLLALLGVSTLHAMVNAVTATLCFALKDAFGLQVTLLVTIASFMSAVLAFVLGVF